MHKIQHHSHSRFLSLCTRFFLLSGICKIAVYFLSSLLKGKSLSQKHITHNSKGKSQNIKLKIQNTKVTSYEHGTQNICTRNTVSHIGFHYTYCVFCADILSSVFITCDFCVLTIAFHVLRTMIFSLEGAIKRSTAITVDVKLQCNNAMQMCGCPDGERKSVERQKRECEYCCMLCS